MQTQEQIDQAAAQEAEESAAMEGVFTQSEDAGAEDTDFNEPEPEEATTDVEGQAETTPDELPQVLTMEQFNAAMEAMKADSKAEISKVHDRVFGKVGELQQRIDSIRATANISPKAKERLAADFPELAEMLFDNEPIPAQVPQQAPQSAVDVDAIITAKLDATSKTFEKRLLEKDHPDWQDVVKTDDFITWRTSVLAPEDSAILADSWDSTFIGRKISEFKTWKAAQLAKTAKQAVKQERLDAAITPQGVPRGATGGAEVDEEEAAMLQAFGKRNRLR